MHFFPVCFEGCLIRVLDPLAALDSWLKACLRVGFSFGIPDLSNAEGGVAPWNLAEERGPSSFGFLTIGFREKRKKNEEKKQRVNRLSFGTMHAHLK